MKKKNAFLYAGFLVGGTFIGYFVIDLQSANKDIPALDVRVDSPAPIVIRDTITRTKIEYKYIYKNRCCCEICKKDTVR